MNQKEVKTNKTKEEPKEQGRRKLNAFDRILTNKWFLLFIFILGAAVFVYPLIADRYYTIIQDDIIVEYFDEVEAMKDKEREEIYQAAQLYNAKLAGIATPEHASIFDDQRFKAVEELLSDVESYFKPDKTIARLSIPKLDVNLPVQIGLSEEVLQRNVGMIPSTSLPVGGKATHSVLTAHRGLPQSRLFRDLDELEYGDKFFVDILGHKLAYSVDNKKVVTPRETGDLVIDQDKDYITLLTCHPYMINSHRLLVRGHRVPYEEEQKVIEEIENIEKEYRWQQLFWKYKEYVIGIAIFIVLAILWTVFDNIRKKKQKNQRPENTETTVSKH